MAVASGPSLAQVLTPAVLRPYLQDPQVLERQAASSSALSGVCRQQLCCCPLGTMVLPCHQHGGWHANGVACRLPPCLQAGALPA
jgi:hypothetical protein